MANGYKIPKKAKIFIHLYALDCRRHEDISAFIGRLIAIMKIQKTSSGMH